MATVSLPMTVVDAACQPTLVMSYSGNCGSGEAASMPSGMQTALLDLVKGYSQCDDPLVVSSVIPGSPCIVEQSEVCTTGSMDGADLESCFELFVSTWREGCNTVPFTTDSEVPVSCEEVPAQNHDDIRKEEGKIPENDAVTPTLPQEDGAGEIAPVNGENTSTPTPAPEDPTNEPVHTNSSDPVKEESASSPDPAKEESSNVPAPAKEDPTNSSDSGKEDITTGLDPGKDGNATRPAPAKEESNSSEPVGSAEEPSNEQSALQGDDYNSLSYAEQVVVLVNQERAAYGLSALRISENVTAAAMIRATEIQTSFSHTRPDGRSFSTALTQKNVSFRGAGENIAYGQSSPEVVVDAWMNSEGHRANILNEKFTTIGIGYLQSANGTKYWVQLFTY
jgi:uncharacterized protein YkwD